MDSAVEMSEMSPGKFFHRIRRPIGAPEVFPFHVVFECVDGDHLGLGEMAAALGMSERTLTARCRAAFASSPTRLYVHHKMEHARLLLAQTDLPIKELSAHLGFVNPYHFSTVYKRVHGTTPTAHRNG